MGISIPIIIIWLIFTFFGVASNRAKAQTRYVNEKAIKEQATEVAGEKPIDTKPASVTPSLVKRQNTKKAFTKPTLEKTHEHKGEVAEAVLLEDRKNDWLARQIKEEARIGSRPYN